MHAPDWVIELRSADKDSIGVPRIDDQTSPSEFTHIGVKFHVLEADQLAQALFYSSPSGIASTSAVQYLLHTQDAKHLMRDWGVGVDDQTAFFRSRHTHAKPSSNASSAPLSKSPNNSPNTTATNSTKSPTSPPWP